MNIPIYTSTNENIYALKEALAPQKGDYVFSVAASLDVPLMLLEQKAAVVGVDIDKDQIEYCHLRKNYLLAKKIPSPIHVPKSFGFLKNKNVSWRNKFMQEMNVDVVLQHLDLLELICGDILNLDLETALSQINGIPLGFSIDYSSFNKVYLSNVFDHYFCDSNVVQANMIKDTDTFFKKFKSGTRFSLTERFIGFDFSQSTQVTEDICLSKKLSTQDGYWNHHVLYKK
ncbi:MAG: hypothetical protein ACOCQQ_02135 [Candidatus Nanoarchaeia archaeon]